MPPRCIRVQAAASRSPRVSHSRPTARSAGLPFTKRWPPAPARRRSSAAIRASPPRWRSSACPRTARRSCCLAPSRLSPVVGDSRRRRPSCPVRSRAHRASASKTSSATTSSTSGVPRARSASAVPTRRPRPSLRPRSRCPTIRASTSWPRWASSPASPASTCRAPWALHRARCARAPTPICSICPRPSKPCQHRSSALRPRAWRNPPARQRSLGVEPRLSRRLSLHRERLPPQGRLPPPQGRWLPPPQGRWLPPPQGRLLPPQGRLLPPQGRLPPPQGRLPPPPQGRLLPPPQGRLPPPQGRLPPPHGRRLPPQGRLPLPSRRPPLHPVGQDPHHYRSPTTAMTAICRSPSTSTYPRRSIPTGSTCQSPSTSTRATKRASARARC
jgi:hypothetical protein